MNIFFDQGGCSSQASQFQTTQRHSKRGAKKDLSNTRKLL